MTLAPPACLRRPLLRWLFPALFAFAGLPAIAHGQTTVTLDASGTEVSVDTTIRGGGYASVNYGTSDSLQTKSDTESSYKRRVLLKFDTQNYIPSGAVITSAQLYLTLKGADDSTSRPIDVYRVTKSFLARQATWLDYRDGMAWGNGGGDLGGRYTTTYVGNAVGSAYKFNLTELVQQSVNGTFGSRYTRLVLVDAGGASSRSLRTFYSSRSSNSALRPKLVISYGSQTSSQSTTRRDAEGDAVEHPWNEGVRRFMQPDANRERHRQAVAGCRQSERGPVLLQIHGLRRCPRAPGIAAPTEDGSRMVSQVHQRLCRAF